jgi:hypothetical protein
MDKSPENNGNYETLCTRDVYGLLTICAGKPHLSALYDVNFKHTALGTSTVKRTDKKRLVN